MRDNFAKRTIDLLAKLVIKHRSNPNCRKPTSGPRTRPTQAVNLGLAQDTTPELIDNDCHDNTTADNGGIRP